MDNKSNTGRNVTLGTILVGILTSAVWDGIKSKPFLSTLEFIGASIWNGIIYFLNLKLKVWWIIVGIIGLLLLIEVIKEFFRRFKESTQELLSYTADTFGTEYLFTWEYHHFLFKFFQADNIQIRCAKDKSLLVNNQCPVCKKIFETEKVNLKNVESMIKLNVENGAYTRRIIEEPPVKD